MAFSFSNASTGSPFGGGASQANGTAQATEGPQLQEIQTNELGFLPIAGESKLKLLPTPWPSDALPPPTSSLLSIASSKGLLAAAGPDTLVIASTEAVRGAFRAEGGNPQKNFDAQVKIPVPRIAQLAFSADENVLVVSGAESGGLAAYEVAGLTNGRTDPALQISTNNTPLRALAPNPAIASPELFAAVTTNGELLMANLKTGQLANGSNGPVLKSGVSCVSWSNKGKQLVAGLADGTASQMTPDGQIKADIPRPPSLPSDMHVSSISWLENDVFLTVYTPSAADDSGMPPPSDFYIVNRQPKTTNFAFQKLPEVCTPFGLNRTPSVQMVARLRKFPPHLDDVLMVCSTSSTDVGLVTKSEQPLSPENVVGSFTMTTMSDDSRRAELPLSGGHDTSPIGMALDLSAKERVDNPILGDTEILQSNDPLPNVMVLNTDGILASWWVIYSTSIRERTVYPGLAVAGPDQAARQSSTTPASPATAAPAFGQPSAPPTSLSSAAPAFGQPAFGQPATTMGGMANAQSAFGKPTFGQSGFGNAGQSGGSPFGKPSTLGGSGGGGFGQPSPLGTNKSTIGFGQPSFGTPSQPAASGSSFGATSSLGNKPTFGGSSSTPQFGQSGFGGASGSGGGAKEGSPFSATPTTNGKSGFSSFANSGGFGAVKPSSENPFAKADGPSAFNKPQVASFGSNMDLSSGFGTPETKAPPAGGPFGAPSEGFKLGSNFKDDGTASDDLSKPKDTSGGSMFGGNFDNILGEAAKEATPAQDKEEEMDEGTDEAPKPTEPVQDPSVALPPSTQSHSTQEEKELVTPPSTIIHSKATPAPPLSNLFGTSTQPNTTPAETAKSKPFSFTNFASTTPTTTPKTVPFPAEPKEDSTPKIKTEPPSENGSPSLENIPEAPLPPDSISKTAYTMGDTSVSSIGSKGSSTPDAPLPPDFLAPKPDAKEPDADEAALPDDGSDLGSDFEDERSQPPSPTEVVSPSAERTDEGEDVTSDFKDSPESSFGKTDGRSPAGGLFTKITPISPQPQSTQRPLFGEINRGAPIFPPPKMQQSPRSPSPIRQFHNDLRPEAIRSASAPIRPGSAIAARRAELLKSQANLPQPTTQEAERIQQEKKTIAQPKAPEPEAQELEDDEADRLRAELDRPVEPSADLDPFLYHQESGEGPAKPGMAGQIERLYRDINSMIDTLGLNSRALSGFIMYQEDPQQHNENWPDVLISDAPADANDADWRLVDIERLNEGYDLLEDILEEATIEDVPGKVQTCQNLLSKDLVQLRSKLSSLRKTLHSKADTNVASKTGLSSEQASIQHDLRKASTALQSKLTETEEALTLLRAKMAELPQDSTKVTNGRSSSLKKPTVEAVTATINKMTLMAEQKSADIDVLEAQLLKLNMGAPNVNGSVNGSRQASVEPDHLLQTPQKSGGNFGDSIIKKTPGSAGTIYHTPESKFGGSIRSTPGRLRSSLRESVTEDGVLVSTQDAEKWRARAQRKRDVEAALKEALKARRAKKQGTSA